MGLDSLKGSKKLNIYEARLSLCREERGLQVYEPDEPPISHFIGAGALKYSEIDLLD